MPSRCRRRVRPNGGRAPGCEGSSDPEQGKGGAFRCRWPTGKKRHSTGTSTGAAIGTPEQSSKPTSRAPVGKHRGQPVLTMFANAGTVQSMCCQMSAATWREAGREPPPRRSASRHPAGLCPLSTCCHGVSQGLYPAKIGASREDDGIFPCNSNRRRERVGEASNVVRGQKGERRPCRAGWAHAREFDASPDSGGRRKRRRASA